MTDRIPCINPRCRRTAAQDKFPDCDEIICGTCFRSLPADLRNENRRCWREYRKWDRRIMRTSDPLKAHRMHDIRNRWAALINRNWDRIRSHIKSPEKPEGLDSFLDSAGLR